MLNRIILILAILLSSLYGSTFASTLNNTSNSNVLNPPPKGDGAMINNVSGVLHDAQINPSKANFLTTGVSNLAKDSQGQAVYLLPDFMGVQFGWAVVSSTIKIQTQCPTAATNYKPTQMITYYSEPLVPQSIDGASSAVAPCIPGQTVTSTLKKAAQQAGAKNVVIMPMISSNASLLQQVVPLSVGGSKPYTMQVAKQKLDQLAKAVATAINNDPNADGVSFDLENPAFGKNSAGKPLPSYEEADFYFISQLANYLVGNKYVGIFDGNQLYAYAQSNNQTWPANVFALRALYGSGSCGAGSNDNMYCTPTGYADGQATVSFPYSNIKVMYVVPASATTQLYEHARLYNSENYPKFKSAK